MTKKEKHVFPENWKEISNEESVKQLEYLLEHYKEYKIKYIANNHIQIGNQIDIWEFYFTSIPAHAVNRARYSEKDKRNQLATKLFDCCIQEARRQNSIREQKYEKIKDCAIWSLFAAVIVTLVGVFYSARKQNKINKVVERYEQSLPNYNEYKQTQQKIASYRDSLINAKTK